MSLEKKRHKHVFLEWMLESATSLLDVNKSYSLDLILSLYLQ